MLARPSQHDRSEHWNGHWGADARFYARRSDGACFAIDAGVSVVDLAVSTPPSPQARRVDSLPHFGRYTLSVFAVAAVDGNSHIQVNPSDAIDTTTGSPRLLAYGVRRRR